MLRWRNWQTPRIQIPVPLWREGSTPSLSTMPVWRNGIRSGFKLRGSFEGVRVRFPRRAPCAIRPSGVLSERPKLGVNWFRRRGVESVRVQAGNLRPGLIKKRGWHNCQRQRRPGCGLNKTKGEEFE